MVTHVRDLLGEPSEGNWLDTQLRRFVNRSYKEVYNQILQLSQEFFITTTDVTWVSGTEEYSFPAGGVHRIALVEYVNGARRDTLRRIPIARKNEFNDRYGLSGQSSTHWFLRANKIGFAPIPRENLTNAVKIWYVPPAADLVTGSAAGSEPPAEWTEQQHEVIIWGAVMRAIVRNKELAKVYQPNFDRIWKGMVEDMQNRDNQDAKTIQPRDDYEDL